MYGGLATIRLNGCGSGSSAIGVEQVALLDGDAVAQPEPLDVPPRDRDRVGADVGGDDGRALQVMRDRRGDAAAAGAQVEHARRLEAGRVARELQHVFDQRLGVRPRDQHRGRDFELEVEEVRPPGEVGDRLLLAGALDERAIGRQLLLGQRAFVVGVELDARDVQDVSEQQLGRQPRGVDFFSREKPAGPFQQPPDRPWPAGLRHAVEL